MDDETYKSLKSFIEQKAKHIRAPLVAGKKLVKVLQNQELYGDASPNDLSGSARHGKVLTEAQLQRILAKVNLETRSHLGRIFTRQAIHEIALQAVNNAKQAKMERLDRFLELNRVILPFDLPDLNGSSSSGSNIHGLLITQRDQILELVSELPSSTDLQMEPTVVEEDHAETSARQAHLLSEYDTKLNALKEKTKTLAILEQKLKYYDGWHHALKQTITTNPAATLEKNMVDASNYDLLSELSRAQEQLAVINSRLEEGKGKQLFQKTNLIGEGYQATIE